MSGSPRVSVVMPVHNRDWCVAEAIESVLASAVEGLELVVVDDGSTDATPTILAAFAARDRRVRVVTHAGRARRGIAASRNLGVAESRGTYLAFLDSDDLLLPGRFAHALDWLDRHPEFAACIEPSSTQLLGHATPSQPRKHLTALDARGNTWLRAMLFDSLYWPICAITLRRAELSRFGRFDEALPFAEETSLWQRLAASNAVGVAQSEHAVCVVRLHSEHSHDAANIVAERNAYLHVLLDTLTWTDRRRHGQGEVRALLRMKLQSTLVEILSDAGLPLSMRVSAWARGIRAYPALAFERAVAANLVRAPWREPATDRA